MYKTSLLTLLFLLTFTTFTFAGEFLSDSWRNEWLDPPAKDRPLQIVHGGIPTSQIESRLTFLRDQCGLGGIVCNCRRDGYLETDDCWNQLVETVATAKKLGLRVWIYDEDGYPSPAAGGLTLKGHPEFEAQELVYDAQNPDEPFTVRDCYEFTHATNNYCALRRYPNVLDGAAMERFLDVTHRAYAEHLTAAGCWDVVEAFFTDEPSTNGVNTGVIPNLVVRTEDEPNPEKKNLPMVIWSRDFPRVYQEMYDEDLMKVRKSLFTGDSPEDKKVRRQFWSMVSALYTQNFMGKIQKWCAENGKCSSGHALHEEALVYHVPCYGNVFAGTNTMHIAGMDFLSSSPQAAMRGWRTATYPASSNIMNGNRLMMTEISDHSERISLKQNAPLENMQFAAAWQAALGCTEFTLYYAVEHRGPEAHKAYCTYVGRLNAALRDAQIVKRALLYYPARDLQEEYKPIAERLDTNSQSDRMKKIIGAYYTHGQFLAEHQIPFMAADDQMLKSAEITKDAAGKAVIWIGNQSAIETILIPSGVTLPEETAAFLDAFQKEGGLLIDENSLNLLETLPTPLTAQSGEPKMVLLGEFARDGKTVYALCNSSTDAEFTGTLSVPRETKSCEILDPLTGEIQTTPVTDGKISVRLEKIQCLIFVCSPND